MQNNLVRYSTGEVPVPWRDREVAREARRLREELQIADFKSKAHMALAAANMKGLVELDQVRRQLAAGDPILEAILMSYEQTAMFKTQNIQRNLYDDFGL